MNIIKKILTTDLFAHWKSDDGIGLTDQQKERLALKISEMTDYLPKIAFFGKTGAGKSSLCNAIFGEDVAAVSDTEACTRSPHEYLLDFHSDRKIVLLDVPGVGESQSRDEEYQALYKALLPELDVLLWVLKADDRALSVDEHVWHESVSGFLAQGCPVFIVINQVDKLNPVREWNERFNQPGHAQQQLIDDKIEVISAAFGLPLERVVPVSAYERYNVGHLIESIVFALPNEKKVSVISAVVSEEVTAEAQQEAERGFFAVVGDFIKNTLKEVEPYIPTIFAVIRGFFGW